MEQEKNILNALNNVRDTYSAMLSSPSITKQRKSEAMHTLKTVKELQAIATYTNALNLPFESPKNASGCYNLGDLSTTIIKTLFKDYSGYKNGVIGATINGTKYDLTSMVNQTITLKKSNNPYLVWVGDRASRSVAFYVISPEMVAKNSGKKISFNLLNESATKKHKMSEMYFKIIEGSK